MTVQAERTRRIIEWKPYAQEDSNNRQSDEEEEPSLDEFEYHCCKREDKQIIWITDLQAPALAEAI